MGCFENYMEFREEVDKIKKERTHKVAPQSPEEENPDDNKCEIVPKYRTAGKPGEDQVPIDEEECAKKEKSIGSYSHLIFLSPP